MGLHLWRIQMVVNGDEVTSWDKNNAFVWSRKSWLLEGAIVHSSGRIE
jgi:hypothetical protein